jgi:hypothetical protein
VVPLADAESQIAAEEARLVAQIAAGDTGEKLTQGGFYECWYVGPADRPGRRQLITAGTFTVDRVGSETFTMWSAADPHRYRIMEITAESPGDAGQHGKVILKGTVRTG